MIWSVFLGVAVAFRHGAMISVDVIQNALPRRLGLSLFLTANLASLLFFTILFWQGLLMTERVVSQSLAALEVSIAWVYAALPVGSAFILIAILADCDTGRDCAWPARRLERCPQRGGRAMNSALGLSLAILFLMGVPIAVAIGLASVIGIETNGRLPLLLVAQRMFTGIDSFPLMAIPLFILAGNLMSAGGISHRLVELAKSLVGGCKVVWPVPAS